MNIHSPAAFTKGASRACCRACSPLLSISASSATPSSMFRISSRNPRSTSRSVADARKHRAAMASGANARNAAAPSGGTGETGETVESAVSAATGVEEPEPPAIEAAAPQAEAPAEQSSERGQERGPERVDEDRDRRGRRSRRRRNRGRGFPESKYADVGRSEQPAPAQEHAPASISSDDFAVISGESLAKYSGAKPLDPDEEEEIAAAQAEADSATGGNLRLSVGDLEQEAVTTAEAAPAEDAVPEGDAAEPAQDEESGEDASLSEPGTEAAPEETAAEPDREAEPTEHAIEESAPTDVAAAGTAEPEENDAQAAEPAQEQPTGQLTATVREHGGRYPHRLSRRMRRKMRGNQPGESHTDEHQHAAPPAVAPAPAAAPAPRSEQRKEAAASSAQPSITELLKEGQEIIVQIAKEPLGQKGARITSHIALPGRYVVYMPTVEHMGVSRKIASDEERQRLKRILQTHRAGVPGGYIVRTAGEGHTEDEIAADMSFLFNLWLDIRQKAEKKPAPALLHHDLDIVQRTLRDQVTDEFKAVWVDNEDVYESVLNFVQRFQPQMVGRIKLYTRETPIFDAFNITAELEKALRPKVWLKSGGYIVLNQTEALVAIDVNTGKYVGKSNRLEDTIVKTNTDAVKEIVRQIRLRDLGGIIVVDFIDMDERRNRQKVMQALEEAMRADRAPYKILSFNDFGLVAITRKRVKQSLERTLCSPCPYCEGAGYVKSVQTVISDILQEARKLAKALDGSDVMLRVHPEVAKVLKSNTNQYLEELEGVLRRPVLVKGDPQIHHEKFDLA